MAADDTRIKELNDAVARFGEAWARGDVAALEAMLSPTYTHTDAFGHVQDRSTWLEYARKRAGRATQIAFHDVRTRVFGDVAIVTGINDLQGPGIREAKDRAHLTIRFTQLWLFRENRWVREAFQATPCEEKVNFE